MFNRKKKKKKNRQSTLARKLITVVRPKHIVSEQFKTIRTNINFSMPDKDLATLLITSSTPGEGKSTISANLAVVFAQEGKKVLLVDADMRKSTVHHTFGLNNFSGLANVLARQATIEEVVQSTSIPGLMVMTSGPIPPNPAELLASRNMESLMARLTETYDIILYDAPPVLAVTDAQILSNKCEGSILVANTGRTEKDEVVKAKEVLEAAQANILGVILNHYKLEHDHYYYQYDNSVE